MSGATPGPWTAEPRENGAVVIRADRKPVAEIWHNGDDPVATGHVVAAAPAMLAALKAVNKLVAEAAMTGFNYADGDWAEKLFHSQQATSRAIRNAEGR